MAWQGRSMRLGWCDGQPLTAPARDDMGEARVGTKKRLSDQTKKLMKDKDAPACRNSLTKKAPYKAQAAPTARPKVPMRRRGADCLVVVRHRLRRPAANETLVSHCRLVRIELRRRVCFFVVLKRVMPVERRGWVIAFEIGSTGNGRNPIFNGRRQPSCGGTSRMTRECQVRICERLGVKFPGPTRPQRHIEPVLSGSACWGEAAVNVAVR